MQRLHGFKPWVAGVLLAWLWFFLPSLLSGITAGRMGQWVLAAVLFSPLLAWRPVLLVSMLLLGLLGAANIVHASYFGVLIDEFFLATALRTTAQETHEMIGTLPPQAWWGVSLWLLGSSLAGRWLWRMAPRLRAAMPVRRCWQAAAGLWAFVLIYTVVQQLTPDLFIRKTKSIYPLYMLRAVMRQQALAQGVLEPPLLPTATVAAAQQVDTLVVVLGESASAQRWSLLGYQGADTNAPLAQLPGVAASTVLAQGWNTAAALPFMLTGRSAHDSMTQRAPSFIDLAQQAGYKTFVLSNSRFFSAQEDFFSMVLRRSSDVYQKLGNGDYDEVLTPGLQAALADAAPRKLIVLHTYGSHPSPASRYPRSRYHYPGGDVYDNSLRYSSDLLAQWIGLLDATAGSGTALLLYSSDHGILLPPCTTEYRHGAGLSSFEVPMLVWSNAALRARQGDVLPDFARPVAAASPAPTLAEHSNALVAETAVRALGYGGLVDQGYWPSSRSPQLDGRAWGQLRQLHACTLQ